MIYDFRRGDKVMLRPELRETSQYSNWPERSNIFIVDRIDGSKMWFKYIGGYMPCSEMCLVEPRLKTRTITEILNDT